MNDFTEELESFVAKNENKQPKNEKQDTKQPNTKINIIEK